MNEAVQLLSKHRGKGAILDSNLLLVYAVGKYDQNMLRHFRHTQQYQEDFDWIERLVVKWFARIHTTPSILAEVNNLGSKLGEGFFDELKKIIATLAETYYPSEKACDDKKFRLVGLTDSTTLAVASELRKVVVTADFDLYGILKARGADAINVNHLRQLHWERASRVSL